MVEKALGGDSKEVSTLFSFVLVWFVVWKGFGMGGRRGRVALLTSVFRDDDGVGAADDGRWIFQVISDLLKGLEILC